MFNYRGSWWRLAWNRFSNYRSWFFAIRIENWYDEAARALCLFLNLIAAEISPERNSKPSVITRWVWIIITYKGRSLISVHNNASGSCDAVVETTNSYGVSTIVVIIWWFHLLLILSVLFQNNDIRRMSGRISKRYDNVVFLISLLLFLLWNFVLYYTGLPKIIDW